MKVESKNLATTIITANSISRGKTLATLFLKNVNVDVAKIIIFKNCICSMLTSIQTYEWAVMIVDTIKGHM